MKFISSTIEDLFKEASFFRLVFDSTDKVLFDFSVFLLFVKTNGNSQFVGVFGKSRRIIFFQNKRSFSRG